FDDLSVFEKPIASASVGQVYKAELYGKTVAVKVQRPDVRDQSTLDLYVIRTAGSIGSLLPWPFLPLCFPTLSDFSGVVQIGAQTYPFQRSTARQSKQLVELIDLTAPTFIQELDYEVEAENQRRFAKTVEDCELIKDAVAVPDIVFANRRILQEWLDGKKLTEPGAAQEQAGRVVKLLLNSYMVQFLETGYLHGDPHPGNFILMGDGRLGILDYGLMTEISGEKRLAFIEFLMHLQAKEYKSCLNDLINLEFFPPALAADKEALDIIVPTLANTLSTLYEEGGDLKKKREL
ncbi:ABC1K3, partial [Symbiodinium necroappetens]